MGRNEIRMRSQFRIKSMKFSHYQEKSLKSKAEMSLELIFHKQA